MTAEIHRQVDTLVGRLRPGQRTTALKGAAFYDRVKSAHLVIATSEPALYANVILRKGVVAPVARPDIQRLA
jgi:L-fucose mutarotase